MDKVLLYFHREYECRTNCRTISQKNKLLAVLLAEIYKHTLITSVITTLEIRISEVKLIRSVIR